MGRFGNGFAATTHRVPRSVRILHFTAFTSLPKGQSVARAGSAGSDKLAGQPASLDDVIELAPREIGVDGKPNQRLVQARNR